MLDDGLTMLWHSLTGLMNDYVELLDDGYFLTVNDTEWDAIGDTPEDAESELRRVANDPQMNMEWDYHFMRGTELLSQVKALAEKW